MRTRELSIEGGLSALFAAAEGKPYLFFLESSLPAGGLGRYSFLGFAPFAVFSVEGKTGVEIRWSDGRREPCAGEPLDALRALHRKFSVPREPLPGGGNDLPFAGGAVGFFSYEFGQRFEGIRRTSADDLAVPDAVWAFYDGVVACDHASGKIFAATHLVDIDAADRVLRRIEADVFDLLKKPRRERHENKRERSVAVTANFTRAGYEQAVGRVKDYIRSGDVYQINLSQRFEAALPCEPVALYRQLCRESPAPYGCFLDFGAVQIAGVSPERFLRVDGDQVTTRPIKGTRRRGRDQGEDARLKAELAASEKDRAELLMIVDLERNDLGRVCVPGSVRVENLYAIEEHPTVWHQAEVSGTLVAGRDVFDCIRAAFPGGSITGAPKVRAMQIIDELEPHRRHVYTGAVGYLGFDGRAELNIAIRTFTCVGGRVYFHAGGGVVWDSDPASEYEETLIKAKALRRALESFSAEAKVTP
jgi:para-aminobenzoate synthetase component 1